MSFSFLFSDEVLYGAFFGKPDAFSLVCKESVYNIIRDYNNSNTPFFSYFSRFC